MLVDLLSGHNREDGETDCENLTLAVGQRTFHESETLHIRSDQAASEMDMRTFVEKILKQL